MRSGIRSPPLKEWIRDSSRVRKPWNPLQYFGEVLRVCEEASFVQRTDVFWLVGWLIGWIGFWRIAVCLVCVLYIRLSVCVFTSSFFFLSLSYLSLLLLSIVVVVCFFEFIY
mmetsp:Transcript_43053/g.108758  ORF Transcript_43053/g.108758 Transcript_43053/m.108758 type:complete len:112 (+) Transcript_43053:957-1292(+)